MRWLGLPGREAEERWRTSSGSAGFAPSITLWTVLCASAQLTFTLTSHFHLVVVVCVCMYVGAHVCVRACLFKNVFVRKQFLTTF